MGKLDNVRRVQRAPESYITITRRVSSPDRNPTQNQGYFQVGAGSDIARMDGIDPLWRFWVGAASPVDADFAIRRDGFFTATGGCISGSVQTTTCFVAGELSGTGSLATLDDVAVMSGGDPTYRLWIGASNAGSANFRVDASGNVYSTGGSFSGSILSASVDVLTGGSVDFNRLRGDLIPDGQHDIGATGSKWGDIWGTSLDVVTGSVSGSLLAGSFSATRVISDLIGGDQTLGATGSRWTGVHAVDGDFSGNLIVSGSLKTGASQAASPLGASPYALVPLLNEEGSPLGYLPVYALA